MSADGWILTVLAVLTVFVGACQLPLLRYRRRRLNGIGKAFGMQRWPGESNRQFADRIRARQQAGGGRRW